MDHLSFSDEQLLNLVNNTILKKTNFDINQFTGGSIGITSTNNNTNTNYKISLFFGYKNNKPVTRTVSINQDMFYIWCKALMLKVRSLHNDNYGMKFSDLNELMQEPSNSVSLSCEKKKSIVEGGVLVDLPVDLPRNLPRLLIQDVTILYNLAHKSAKELSNIKLSEIGLSNELEEYMTTTNSKLASLVTYATNNTLWLINELHEKENYK